MKASRFLSGGLPRVGAAVGYGILAFGTVALVVPPTRTSRSVPTVATTSISGGEAKVFVRILIESVRPVAAWTVRNGGVLVAADSQGDSFWEAATMCETVDFSIVATTGAEAPANALRIRLEAEGARYEQIHWCTGDCVVTIGPETFTPEAASAL